MQLSSLAAHTVQNIGKTYTLGEYTRMVGNENKRVLSLFSIIMFTVTFPMHVLAVYNMSMTG